MNALSMKGLLESVGVLSAGGGESGLSAASALDEPGGVAYVLAGVPARGHEVVGVHEQELRLAVAQICRHEGGVVEVLLENQRGVAHHRGVDVPFGHDSRGYEADAVDLLGLCFEHAGHLGRLLAVEFLSLLLEGGVVLDELGDGSGQVGHVVEERAGGLEHVLHAVDELLGLGSGHCLDSPYAGGYRGFADYLEQSDAAGGGGVAAAAELHAGAEPDDSHAVAVLLAEQGDGAHSAGLVHRGVALLLERQVLAYELVDPALHQHDLLVGELLEVGEVEAEVLVAHEGALLLHVFPENLAEGAVEQVRAAVVALDPAAAGGVDPEGEAAAAVLREPLGYVDGEVVLLDGVADAHLLPVFRHEHSGVADLAAHLPVERGAVEDELEHLLVLLHHGPLLEEQGAGGLGLVVAGELHVLAVVVDGPVAEAVGGGVAGPLLLLAELHVEVVDVDLVAVLCGDEFGEVDGEAVGVVEPESVGSGDRPAVGGAREALVEQLDSAVEGAQEGHLLLAQHVLYELLLLCDFGVGGSHVVHELVHQAAEEGFGESEEGVAVAHGAAQDAAYHVAGLDVGGQLSVGYAEADGPDVVGYHPHGHVGRFALAVAVAGDLAYSGEHAAEHVGVVVAALALEHRTEAFESHSGVDVLGGKRFEVAVGHALVLHEHEVPYLDHVGVGLVHELASGYAAGGLLLVGAYVDVDFGAGAAGAGVAHLPEVVMLVAQQHVVLGKVLEPGLARLGVEAGAVFGRTFEHGGVEQVPVDAVDLGQQLPRPVDGLGLEVVAEAPVAEHLEHRVVVGIVSDYVLELVHSGVGEHQRGVVLDHHGCGRHHRMSLRCEEIEKFLSNFVGSHISLNHINKLQNYRKIPIFARIWRNMFSTLRHSALVPLPASPGRCV